MKLRTLFSALLIAVILLPLSASAETQKKNKKKDVSIQLYSLRSILDGVNPNGTVSDRYTKLLNDLAEMGFTSVEAANYDYGKGTFYGRTPEQFKADCEKAGLQTLSSHTHRGLSAKELETGDFSESLEWWKKCVADHKAAGFKYIVSPWRAGTKNAQEMLVQCKYLNAIGKLCKENGIKYGYHNHNGEFEGELDGKKIYDWMVENTDPQYVFFEMDVYWAVIGNVSPVYYFKKYPGRFKLLHIKDWREVGQSGMVGFEPIFNNAETAGLEHFVIELEQSLNPSIVEGVRESINYILDSKFVKSSYCK